jgi:hypothetical protein
MWAFPGAGKRLRRPCAASTATPELSPRSAEPLVELRELPPNPRQRSEALNRSTSGRAARRSSRTRIGAIAAVHRSRAALFAVNRKTIPCARGGEVEIDAANVPPDRRPYALPPG